MAQFHNVLLCGVTGAALWTLLGWPIASHLARAPFSVFLAPLLGWATFSAIALPLFGSIGMSRPVVLLAVALAAAVALISGRPNFRLREAWPVLALLAGAIVLACAPAAAILPKATLDGVTLASPIFDHSKIALIDEMIRSGVPSRNPFFYEIGAPDRVAYYYLWHFSAAVLAVITGVSGWEADAAVTWFTGFASLLVMIGVTIRISGRPLAGWAVLVLAAAASIRTVLEWIAPGVTPSLIGWSSGFGGWLFQSSWAPQHVMSASCVLLAVLLLPRLASRDGWLAPIALGLVAAAAFQSSVWVGGVIFAPAAIAIGLHLLRSIDPAQRSAFVTRAVLAAGIASLLSLPFIYDQLASSGQRGGNIPIKVTPVAVLGEAVPAGFRRILDVPAFWLICLPVEFAAFYCAGLLGLVWMLRSRIADADLRFTLHSFALLAGISLGAAWLLASVIGDNNDLGWRGVLPGAMLLIVFAAATISRWPERPARIAGALAAAGTLLALPETASIVRENLFGLPKASARTFAATPSLWQAVRQHAGPDERVANNPLMLADMTPWPVNISWALLANRRSCYAGRELALPFAPIPNRRREAIETQFVRVFAGEPAPDDIRDLADRFRCDVVVVTPQDGAWARDPFLTGGHYRLIETQPNWRIYRRAAVAQAD